LDYPKSFKVFIGPGNNKMLVKGLMKRRNWWSIVDKSDECHFAWTQIKIPDIFNCQKKC
jgi:tubulin--tyrosine ligase